MRTKLATTRLFSNGQVVIPGEIRDSLCLKTGDKFIVFGKGDTIILKSISEPSLEEFDDLLAEAAKQAKKAVMNTNDIKNAIEGARKRR